MMWILIVASLALYLIPAALLHRSSYRFSRDYLVSARGTSDGIFQNSSIAYAIQLATFGPFFVWGVSGDWIPGVWNSAFYCLGLSLLYFFRRPIADFVRVALSNDRSITIHEFIAHFHGHSPWVRIIASSLTIVALWGIVMSEIFGISAALAPLLGTGPEGSFLLVICLFFLMFAYSTLGGNDGVMRMDQLQLGVGYIGLFAAVVGMIFLFSQSYLSGTQSSAIPVVFFAIFGVLWLLIRRFRFIEVRTAAVHPDEGGASKRTLWQTYLRIERVVGALVVLTVIVMVASTAGFVAIEGPLKVFEAVRHSVGMSTDMSALALFALALLPLGYQLVDITNWQRFAAAGDPTRYAGGPGKRALLVYIFEAPLVWVSLLAFGALAAGIFGNLSDAANPFGEFALRLVGLNTFAGAVTVSAFLIAVLAIGFSTMDAVFSATQAAFQYDLLPAFDRTRTTAIPTTRKIRTTRLFNLATYVVVIAMLYVVEKYLAFGRDQYLGLLLAFYSAQLTFVPLVLGAFLSQRRLGGQSPVSPVFAVGALLSGAFVGIGATVGAIVGGGDELLLWGAIPASLFVSGTVYVVGWHAGKWRLAGSKA